MSVVSVKVMNPTAEKRVGERIAREGDSMGLFRLMAWGIRIFLMGSSATLMFLMAAIGVAHLGGDQLTAEQIIGGGFSTLNFMASGLIILYVEVWICWYRLRRVV